MLQPGDTIGVAAPASCFDLDRFHKGLDCLRNMGFTVHVPQEIFERKRYLAGEDHVRAQVINTLFADPAIKGIICARGGFGSMRILSQLDWDQIKNSSALVMGFSDVSALLSALVDKARICVIHSPNVLSLADAGPETLDSFFRAVTGNALPVKADRFLAEGRAQGILKGGNLSTLSHLVGTGFQPDFTDAIVFFEDVREPAYKIDRMLSQMKMANMFDAVSGVIMGDFTSCDHCELLPEIFEDIFLSGNIPILAGVHAGHGKVNLSLPLGQMVSIDSKTLEVRWKNL